MTFPLERAQPLRKERGRHPRAALVDLGEGVAAKVDVAQDQRRPSLAQDL